MSGAQAGVPAHDPAGLLSPAPARVLKPWALLERLRPVRLAAFGRRLGEYDRLRQGLGLLAGHFPEAYQAEANLAEVGWWQPLGRLIGQAEAAGWFEPAWPRLNRAFGQLRRDGDGRELALYLTYIPVQLYGLSHTQLDEARPALELMHLLLSECEPQAISERLLTGAGLFDDSLGWDLAEIWGQAERRRAWGWLEAIEADPGLYPGPARWLPELARWACHRTGNLLLDQVFGPEQGPWFGWAHHLDFIKSGWQRARPVLEAGRRLEAWCEREADHLALLAEILMEGIHYELLDW